MIKCPDGYSLILVKSFKSIEKNHRYPIEIRPLPNQVFPSDLLVECSSRMRDNYPVGMVFRICAQWKQKQDCRPHLYTSYRWPFEVMEVSV